jgi:hypothetical protein
MAIQLSTPQAQQGALCGQGFAFNATLGTAAHVTAEVFDSPPPTAAQCTKSPTNYNSTTGVFKFDGNLTAKHSADPGVLNFLKIIAIYYNGNGEPTEEDLTTPFYGITSDHTECPPQAPNPPVV